MLGLAKRVKAKLHDSRRPEDLLRSVSVAPVATSNIVAVTAEGGSPKRLTYTATLGRDAHGHLVRKAGVMGVVVTGGTVCPGDPIRVELPPTPHRPLQPV